MDGAGVAHSSAAQQLEGSCRTGIVTHAETLQQQGQQEEATATRGGNSEGRQTAGAEQEKPHVFVDCARIWLCKRTEPARLLQQRAV